MRDQRKHDHHGMRRGEERRTDGEHEHAAGARDDATHAGEHREADDDARAVGRDTRPREPATENTPERNPPTTTTGDLTAPKFGSAGSGGAEAEPGPPRP